MSEGVIITLIICLTIIIVVRSIFSKMTIKIKHDWKDEQDDE